jgi:hypothetical protein
MLPNPVKSTTVNFPIYKLDEAVRNISVVDKRFKLIKSNPAFNQYIYEISEFLSLGANVFIDLNEITSEKTEIKMEVRRVVGTFNHAHEVQRASEHTDKLLEVIAKIVSGEINLIDKSSTSDRKSNSPNNFRSLFLTDESSTLDRKSNWYDSFGWMLFWAILFFPIAVYGLFKSTMSLTNKVTIGVIISIFLLVYSRNTTDKNKQLESTVENIEITTKSKESENSFEILSKKSVGNMVNINVLTTKKLISKSEMEKAAFKLRELYCQSEQCNVISLWKDAEIYKLYEDNRTENENPMWMKKIGLI